MYRLIQTHPKSGKPRKTQEDSMTTAIIITLLVFAFIIGGMIILLKSAKKHKFPDTYDKSKVGFDDEEDWPQKKPEDSTNKNADEPKNEKLHKD